MGGKPLVALGEMGGERWNEFLRMPLGRFALAGGGECGTGLVLSRVVMAAMLCLKVSVVVVVVIVGGGGDGTMMIKVAGNSGDEENGALVGWC